MDPVVVRLRGDFGAQNYLVFKEGRKLLHAVTMDGQVRLVTMPKEEARYFQPLEHRGKPYPVARACRRYLSAGKTIGITDGAKDALVEIKGAAS